MFKLAVYLFALFICINSIVANESIKVAESGDKKDAQAPRSCYVCNENTDSNCGDPITGAENLVKKCEEGENFCRKTIQFGKIPCQA